MMSNANGAMYTNIESIKNLMKDYDKSGDYINPNNGLAGLLVTDENAVREADPNWEVGKPVKSGLFENRNFNLNNIIINSVNDIFIDSFFIGVARQCQSLFLRKVQHLLITQGESIPTAFVKGL